MSTLQACLKAKQSANKIPKFDDGLEDGSSMQESITEEDEEDCSGREGDDSKKVSLDMSKVNASTGGKTPGSKKKKMTKY